MPNIDPSNFYSTEPPQSLNPSSLSLTKPNAAAITAAAAQKASKTDKDKAQQRIDIEPIYTQLKSAIGEKWADYKETLGLFALGQLNQPELCVQINHLVGYSADTEHLHNCLITALFANCHRDPPEPGVAPWVSANDKPAAGTGSGAVSKGGDKVEERLKKGVMALPGRDRRRLKEIGEKEPYDPNASFPISAQNEYRIARSIKLPDNVPASAGGLSKTNWDLEIRKRYTQSLSHETLEFPDTASIQHRMLPICYEESVPNGPADQCADFVATATEMYIKDIVSSLLSLTRSNFLPHHSSHSKHSLTNGHINGQHKPSGTLGSVGGRPISLADMRFALENNACNMGSMPDIIEDIKNGWPEGVLEGWDDYDQELNLDVPTGLSLNPNVIPTTQSLLEQTNDKPLTNGILVNGIGASHGALLPTAKRKRQLTNGEIAHFKGFNEPGTDGWAGSSSHDRDGLFSVLDECLNLGQ